ncbi:MAG: VPS10 domain-containing protein [Acidobacteriota bacterium]
MKKVFLLAFILALSWQIFPQWVQTSGPTGGIIGLMSSSGNNAVIVTYPDIYSNSGPVLYISTDQGLTWKDISPMQPDSSVFSVASNSNDIFVGGGKGIFRSSDKGQSWMNITKGINSNETGSYDITAIKATDSIIVAGSVNKAYLSTDKGATWKDISSGLPKDIFVSGFVISDFLIKNNYIFAISGNYFGKGIYRFKDTSWTKVSSGLSDSIQVFSMIAVGDTLFAGTDRGIFISSNNGEQWNAPSGGMAPGEYITGLTATDSSIIAGTLFGLFRSTDRGNSWEAVILDSQIVWIDISSLQTAGKNVLAGTYQGMYISGDKGKTWKKANTGIVSTPIISLAARGGTIFASSHGIFRSTDEGANWQEVNKGITYTEFGYPYINKLFVKDSIIFAGSEGSGILISTDNGESWSQSNNGFSLGTDSVISVTTFASSGNNIFAGTYDKGVYMSTDNGKNWKEVSNGLPKPTDSNKGGYSYIFSLYAAGNNLLAGINFQKTNTVFISTDNGSSWKETTSLLKDKYISDFVSTGNYIFAGGEGGVYSSSDAGLSWKKTGGFLQDSMGLVSDVKVLGIKDSILFASVDIIQISDFKQMGSIFRSTDFGGSWKDIRAGMPANIPITSFTSTNNFIFAGTDGRGVWKLPVSALAKGNIQTASISPYKFMLEQNYPNPFNPVTTISYSIPADSKVKLTVYNLLGEEIKTLVNEAVKAGKYKIVFRAGDLPSGVYFYNLEAKPISGNNDFRSTRKFILLK